MGTGRLSETAFWFGEGGIARPRRGVRGPLLLLPGIGGRSRGAGEFRGAGEGQGTCEDADAMFAGGGGLPKGIS